MIALTVQKFQNLHIKPRRNLTDALVPTEEMLELAFFVEKRNILSNFLFPYNDIVVQWSQVK